MLEYLHCAICVTNDYKNKGYTELRREGAALHKGFTFHSNHFNTHLFFS